MVFGSGKVLSVKHFSMNNRLHLYWFNLIAYNHKQFDTNQVINTTFA